jgi:hypothetical protein
MSISPFTARPGSPQREQGRARLVVLLVTLGIAASLLAYAISPGVRHAVGHAAHSVKGAVGRVLDHDKNRKAHKAGAVTSTAAARPAAAPAAARTTATAP